MMFSAGEMVAQRGNNKTVTYEEAYDEPYNINKLFVQFQPVYGELFVTNINAGFGLEATYFWDDKFDFRAHARKTYTSQFDITRDGAERNSQVDNAPFIYNYYEFGATYHLKDEEQSSKTKMFLYRKSYRGNRWASRIPKKAEIPSKVRKVTGIRLGGLIYDTSSDFNRAIEAQGLTNGDFMSLDGSMALPSDVSVYGNLSVAGGYVGASYTWIRNVAVQFDRYQPGVDDLILTTFFDIIVAPSVTVENIFYQDQEFSAEPLQTSAIGFRLGVDGKFNRTLGWSYGAEIGSRPSLQNRGFYALIKISFPVFSTNLDNEVEAFGK